MSKDDFWNLIAEAKKECGQDLSLTARWIEDRLVTLGPQQAHDFDCISYGYVRLGDQYGLQSAASIIWECSTDDGFGAFLPWLIAQGKDVYLAALKNPDSLADIEPYGGCEFESLLNSGTRALRSMPNANEHISLLYKEIPEDLEKDIIYGEGIGYPYEWSELPQYVPRLCAKYLTMEELAVKAEKEPIWNPDNPEIQTLRAAGPQNAAPYRHKYTDVGHNVDPARDIEQVIIKMKQETFREIQNDREFPAGQLAWYWSYLGALDMAQQLGLISDAHRQALYHEAERFKPDCVVTSVEFDPQDEATTEMKIGGIT